MGPRLKSWWRKKESEKSSAGLTHDFHFTKCLELGLPSLFSAGEMMSLSLGF